MASGQDLIFGQIGAAKIFCGKLSDNLNMKKVGRDKQISELEEQIAHADDDRQITKLRKKQDRLTKLRNKTAMAEQRAENAVDYLSRLAETVDIGRDKIIEFIADTITVAMPAMELAVKTALLANIKKLTACALDVRIPEVLRKEGMLLNETEIDPRMILFMPPMSKYGHFQYFGCDREGMSSYELAKAEDMNAFIWFVKNCAMFVNPIIINNGTNSMSTYFKNASGILKEGVYTKADDHPGLTVGTVLKDTSASNTLYLIDSVLHENDTTTYSIKPISNSTTSVNWYGKAKIQNAENRRKQPLFSLTYSNVYNSSAKLPLHNFKFKILQEPFKVNTVLASGDLTGILPQKVLFDEDGTYNRRGKFTIREDLFTITNVTSQMAGDSPQNRYVSYHLIPKVDIGGDVYLIYEKSSGLFKFGRTTDTDNHLWTFIENEREIRVRELDGQNSQEDAILATKILTECYKGDTVYEFNHDYIMSFKLFDEKVIAANVINALLSIDLPISLESLMKSVLNKKQQTASSYNQLYINTMTDRMIQKILDSETDEYSSCFYTFSNQEYIDMEEQTALKVINGQLVKQETVSALTSAFNILDAYDTEASLNEKKETITRSIVKALETTEQNGDNYLATSDVNSSNGVNRSDSTSSFIKKAMRALIKELTYAILSPKVLMLIAVNQRLMQNELASNENYKFSIEDVLKGVQGIIKSIVGEIIDSIEKELLRVILARITEIMNGYTLALAKEYASKWKAFIKSLLSCFKGSSSRRRQGYGDNTDDTIDEILTQIDTADLDELADQIIPDTNPCD